MLTKILQTARKFNFQIIVKNGDPAPRFDPPLASNEYERFVEAASAILKMRQLMPYLPVGIISGRKQASVRLSA